MKEPNHVHIIGRTMTIDGEYGVFIPADWFELMELIYREKALISSDRKQYFEGKRDLMHDCRHAIDEKQRLEDLHNHNEKQPDNMIQWTGNNLKEVVDFTGKSPKFGEWFKSWEEYENYVHTHNDILKLFCDDGSHYEVPVGDWIVKTPDGYNVPSVAKFIHAKQKQPEVEKEITPSLVENMLCEFGVQSIDDMDSETLAEFARHFWNKGYNARNEEL